MFQNPFSFEGRIRRTEYGLSIIIAVGCIVAIDLFAFATEIPMLVFLFYIPVFWFMWAQAAKRCHDLGNSGWFQLIPLYGFWLLFADGRVGENEYGYNPKGIGNPEPPRSGPVY